MLETSSIPNNDFSVLLINLLKEVQYRETDEKRWQRLIDLQAQLRDYVSVLGLDLILNEADGYAYLRSKPDDLELTNALPRLMARRPLSFPVSMLLALLRKHLAEFDASGADSRLIVSRDDIVQRLQTFLPDSNNEARMIDQIDTHINKVIELGFLRRLKQNSGPTQYEVLRILKAFIDAQWLAEFDSRLANYQTYLLEQQEYE